MTGRLGVSAPPTARAARRRLRAGRAAGSLTERLGELYQRLLYLAVFAGLPVQAVVTALGREPATPTPAVVLTRWLVVVGVLAVLAGTAKAVLGIGPLVVRPPTLAWLLTSPIDRRTLLGRALAAVVLVGAAVGAVIAVLAVALLGLPAAVLPGWTACGALVGACQGAGGVFLQPRPRWRGTVQTVLSALLGMLACGVGALLVLAPVDLPVDAAGGVPTPVVAVLAVLACGGLVGAWRTSGRLTRGQLSEAADVVTATTTSVAFLDPTLFWSAVRARRLRAVGRVRSAPLRGSRIAVLARADLIRVLRSRTGPLCWVALLPVPYAAALIGAGDAVPAVQLVAAFLATTVLAGGLRLTCRSPALRRAVGGSDRAQRLAHLIVPAAGALLWVVLTWVAPTWATPTAIPTGDVPLPAALLSFVGAVATTYRMATGRPPDYSSPSFDAGPLGSLPPGLILQLVRGPALLVVLVFVQIWLAGG